MAQAFFKFVEEEYGYTEEEFRKLDVNFRRLIWEDFVGSLG